MLRFVFRYGEIIGAAMRVYGVNLDEIERGSELQIKKPDGEIVILRLRLNPSSNWVERSAIIMRKT